VSADVTSPPTDATPSGQDPAQTPISQRRSRNPFARRLPWWGEILIAVGFYWLYDVVQALTGSDAAHATRNAHDVINAEKSLHIWAEPEINRWASHSHLLSLIAGYDYALAHVLVTGSVLAFLWWRRPRLEVPLRNGLVAFSVLALIVYWLYPVAPPRLTDHSLVDTLIVHDILGARHVSQGVVNLYAAMPSLHVAWSLWCAGAIVLSFRSRWRHLAWLYPTWTTFVIVATANHYFLDAAAGAVFAVVPLAIVARREARAGWSPP
jgi:hypothetical protein